MLLLLRKLQWFQEFFARNQGGAGQRPIYIFYYFTEPKRAKFFIWGTERSED